MFMLSSSENRVISCLIAIAYSVLYYYNFTKFDLALYVQIGKIIRIDIVMLVGVTTIISLCIYKYRTKISTFDYLIEALCTVISVMSIFSVIDFN